jgi:hypothetical protein
MNGKYHAIPSPGCCRIESPLIFDCSELLSLGIKNSQIESKSGKVVA